MGRDKNKSECDAECARKDARAEDLAKAARERDEKTLARIADEIKREGGE